MAITPAALGVETQISQKVYEDQTFFQKKSNTIVTVAGLIITILISAFTYIIEGGYSWMPAWLPAIMPFLGFAATALKVSNTKNGITPSILQAIQDAADEIIKTRNQFQTSQPVTSIETPLTSDPTTRLPVNELANQLDDLAKSFAKER